MVPLPLDQPPLNVHRYNKYTDEPRDKILYLYITEDLKKRLKAAAFRNEVKMNDVANQAILEYLESHCY